MNKQPIISPWRVIIPTSLGTGLAIIGDTSLYTVLPTHIVEAGVTLGSVGILLSANRFIRLVLNGPMGWVYDRFPRRYLFVASVFIGAVSTAMYALTQGFTPLLIGRLLWGLAWAGIWVGGNALILDVTDVHNRGRWVGIYQISFFLGAATGAVAGGFLTDWLGYHSAMGIEAGLGFIGAILAFILLPEVPRTKHIKPANDTTTLLPPHSSKQSRLGELVSAMGLLGVNRLLIAGLLLPTFGLFLLQQLGEQIQIAGYVIGVASLTGIGLGANSLISMGVGPVFGRWSDYTRTRWQAAAGGLGAGVAGFGVLAVGTPVAILCGIPLTAIAGGSGQGLATAIVGDLSTEQNRGQHLGWLFTVGDLASAILPPLTYGIIPWLGLQPLYLLSTGVYGLMLLVALRWIFFAKKSCF